MMWSFSWISEYAAIFANPVIGLFMSMIVCALVSIVGMIPFTVYSGLNQLGCQVLAYVNSATS
jgi:hypothetical protein